MIGFHIDMNMAHYRADYLLMWLSELAARGYDTILWELENNVAWETCPECVSADALSKQQFRELLGQARSLGLSSIPLLQTIGHAEYVLKHARYAGLRELPERIDQYCPRNEAVLPFLHRWIDEYLDLFGDVTIFHLGADEAWALGSCSRCSQFAADHSLSRLYIDHINALVRPLVRRGIKPAIWADMVLHHNEALDYLSRDVMLFDWMYDIYRDNGRVWIWGEGMCAREDLSPAAIDLFGPYLFPQGDEPGREPETFYSADFLADRGFDVVTCPSSSSFGDNVFSPRHWLHVANTFDSLRKGMASDLVGSVLTSWSVRLHPWEVQLSSIDVPRFLIERSNGKLEEFADWYIAREFGVHDAGLWRSFGLLSKSCLFSDSGTLGFGKACVPVAPDHVQMTLSRMRDSGAVETAKANCEARLAEYREAHDGLMRFTVAATRGRRYLRAWDLAARNLINRAAVSSCLLSHAEYVTSSRPLRGAERSAALALLAELRELRRETAAFYRAAMGPVSSELMVGYMFAAVEDALVQLAADTPHPSRHP